MERSSSSNEVDLVEHQFLVTKLKSIINTLESDSRKYNFPRSHGLRKKLNDLKQALSPNNGDNILNKDSLYRIKNVLIDWDLHSNKFSVFSNYSRYLFISKIATLKNELILRATQNNHESSRFANTTHENIPQNPNPVQIIELSTRFPDSNAHGIEDKISSMVRMLSLRRENNGEEFRAVGIYGIRGVGKTMLCQQVFKHQNVQSCFLPRIWVCLSKTEGVDNEDHRKVVVKRMLEALGVEEEVIKFAEIKQDLKGLLYVLRLQLVRKNYLIVLDDACKEDQNEFFSGLDKDENLCEKLAYGLPKGYGGAVVVTSRWQEKVNFMVGRDRTQCLTSTLDSESCWLIFKEEAEKGDLCVLSEDLKALKDEIIRKCNGLPLAGKLLGQFARESFIEEIKAQQSIVTHSIDNNGIQL